MSPHRLNQHYLVYPRYRRVYDSGQCESESPVGTLAIDFTGDVQFMSSIKFTLPVSFLSGDGAVDANPLKAITDAVKMACVRSEPSSLTSWGSAPHNNSDLGDPAMRKGHPIYGTVMGCTDGTLYIFHPTPGTKLDPLSPVHMNFDLLDIPRPSSSQSNLKLTTAHSRSSSRSSAKSPTSPPFHVSKSRILSGLSVEQVEAPKNFVDFDDEPDKLKDMLKGRGGAKDKSMLEGLLPNFEKGAVLDKGEPPSNSRRKDDSKSNLLSASNSPSLKAPIANSVPPSPMMLPAGVRSDPYSLSPKCHVFPQRFGPTLGVVQVAMIARDQFFVSLQAQGYAIFYLIGCSQLIVRLETFQLLPSPTDLVLQLIGVIRETSLDPQEH